MGSATEWGLHSLDRLADRENVSKNLKDVRERAVGVFQGRAMLAEGTTYAKALRKQHAWKSKEAQVAREKRATGRRTG